MISPLFSLLPKMSQPFRGTICAAVVLLILGYYFIGGFVTPDDTGALYLARPQLHTGKFPGDPWRTNLTVDAIELVNTKWLRIEAHRVRTPEGDRIMDDWIWIDEQDQVNVLVRLRDTGKYVVYRQSKYGMRFPTLATVGGLVESGETPHQAASRELLEEMGMVAEKLVFLGKYRVHANRGDGHVSCFLAEGVAPAAARAESDDLEAQQWVHMDRGELMRALLAGEFQEVKWTATVALAMLHGEM